MKKLSEISMFGIFLFLLFFGVGIIVGFELGDKDTRYRSKHDQCKKELEDVYRSKGGIVDMYIECQKELIAERKIQRRKIIPIQENDLGPSRVLLGLASRGSGKTHPWSLVQTDNNLRNNDLQSPNLKGEHYEEDLVAGSRAVDCNNPRNGSRL